MTNEYGTFDIELHYRGYSVHNYVVVKTSGEWPDKRSIAAMCDDRSLDYFGFDVLVKEDRAAVAIYVD